MCEVVALMMCEVGGSIRAPGSLHVKASSGKILSLIISV